MLPNYTKEEEKIIEKCVMYIYVFHVPLPVLIIITVFSPENF